MSATPQNFASRCEVKPPIGRAAAYEFAGFDPKLHIGYDGRILPMWEATNIVRTVIPAPLTYCDGGVVTRMAVHRKIAPYLMKALAEISAAGLYQHLEPYAGGFEFRRSRGSDKLSMHAIGLAIDFDPLGNPFLEPPETTFFGETSEGQAIVRLFEIHGFFWGGRFARPDAMHFQWATEV